MKSKYKNLRERRRARAKAKMKGSQRRPRLSVFRSGKHIYAQLIDDERGKTLASASDLALPDKSKKTKTELAKLAGQVLAQKAPKKGIKLVVFDRGGYKYHGRVKALAEGARVGGLKF